MSDKNSQPNHYPYERGRENRRRIEVFDNELDEIDERMLTLDKRTKVSRAVLERIEDRMKWMTNLLIGNLLALIGILVAGVITLIANLA
jgi:hypothetical protein